MSNIDPSKPTEGQATTQSVRDNFSAAATEIDSNKAASDQNAQDIATLDQEVQTLDAQNVKLTGNQTIADSKTFSAPVAQSAAQGGDAANLTRKDYVDQQIANIDLGDYQLLAEKGAVEGYAPLNLSAVVPPENLPFTSMTFQGGWDAGPGILPVPTDGGQLWIITGAGTLNVVPADGSSQIPVPTAVSVDQYIIYSDVDLFFYQLTPTFAAFDTRYLQLAGGTVTGQVNGITPTAAANLTRKDYVDANFNKYLAGYNDDGLHEQFTGDLDDISVNSGYYANPVSVTNFPPDAVGTVGIVFTDMGVNDTLASQRWIGLNSNTIYREWRRVWRNSAWDVWKLVVDGGAFTERLAGYADTGKHVAYNADLNDIAVNSTYHINPASVTNEPPDMVADGFITTFIYPFSTPFATQVIVGMQGSSDYKQWMRHNDTGVWNAWKLVVDGGALEFINGDALFSNDILFNQTGPVIRNMFTGAGVFLDFDFSEQTENAAYRFGRGTTNANLRTFWHKGDGTSASAMNLNHTTGILTITGKATVSEQPVNDDDLTRKDYVDSNPTMVRTGTRLDITNVST
jgi:hypothetical protein